MKNKFLILIMLCISNLVMSQTVEIEFSGYSLGYEEESILRYTDINLIEGSILLSVEDKSIYITTGNKIESYSIKAVRKIGNCYEAAVIKDSTGDKLITIECITTPYFFLVGDKIVYRYHIKTESERNNGKDKKNKTSY